MQKKCIMLILFLGSSLFSKDHNAFTKKCNTYFYSKIGVTLTVGPLIGALIGVANKNAESTNAKLPEKLILFCIFGIINGMATKSASYVLDCLDIPHSERGLGTSSWLASWIAYFIASHQKDNFKIPDIGKKRPFIKKGNLRYY
jgi:hypothetical protein